MSVGDQHESTTPVDDDQPKMGWYILKVQSNRENSICDGLRRRVSVAGLDEYFGDILVPTEDVAEFKNGKRRVVKRKLYPGYIVVNMVINEETWFLVRETPGIGDFTGAAGKPTPMLPHEVERIVKAVRPDEESAEPIKTAIPFKVGDRVRIKEGTFENFEGDVDVIDEANGRVTVMINIFGRSTPVELEHWQIESV
jgi:transcriptional antiterminator NusG